MTGGPNPIVNNYSRHDESSPLISKHTNRHSDNSSGSSNSHISANDCVSQIEEEFEVHDIAPSIDIGDHEATFSLRKLIRFAGPGFAMSIAYVDPGNICSDLHCGAVAGYKLIWLLFLTHALGLYIQTLSARIGIVTGQNLAQHCHRQYTKRIRIPLWLICELAIIGSDIQEAIGTAIALYLLFGIAVWKGILLAASLSYAILGIQRFGARKVEAILIAMIAVMCGCFGIEVLMAKPDFGQIAEGLFVPRIPANAMVQAVGIVGAVIMPHNLFLHSALVGTRRIKRGSTVRHASIREANFYTVLESAIALLFSFTINATILIVFADIYSMGNGVDPTGLRGALARTAEAAGLLEKAFGKAGPLLWAIGLLASGQSSTATGTMAGQFLMEGMMKLQVSPWLRMFISRSISLVPTMLVGTLATKYLDHLALPFALIPTLKFAQSKGIMTGDFALGPYWRAFGWATAAAIIALNVYLLLPLVLQMAVQSMVAAALAYTSFGVYLTLVGVLVFADVE
ncbi:natural resistance-associated macrophage protein-domain-containing protein [Coemansia spiralis]|nr:natural resistance-associated macrophage protein-domain-containing protein [Coemansia spiralis]